MNQLEPLDYAVNNNHYYIALYICQHCISSDEMLNPNRITMTIINLIKYVISKWTWVCIKNEAPMWKVPMGTVFFNLWERPRQLSHIQCMPSVVVSKILTSHSAAVAYFKPD